MIWIGCGLKKPGSARGNGAISNEAAVVVDSGRASDSGGFGGALQIDSLVDQIRREWTELVWRSGSRTCRTRIGGIGQPHWHIEGSDGGYKQDDGGSGVV